MENLSSEVESQAPLSQPPVKNKKFHDTIPQIQLQEEIPQPLTQAF